MEETFVRSLKQINKYSDELTIEKEIKLNCYHSYISSYFVKSDLRLKLLSINYIDIELNKILKLNTENNILIVKFEWWKVSCQESLVGKPFAVPILRILNQLFYEDKIIKLRILNLIQFFQVYALEKNTRYKMKYYHRYIKYKNDFLTYILDIKTIDNRAYKALNYALLYKTYEKFNKNKEKNIFLKKSKLYCKRPSSNVLILFLLNSKLNFNKLLLLKQIFYVKFRYW